MEFATSKSLLLAALPSVLTMATPNSNMESKNAPRQQDSVKQTAADDISDQAERVDGEDDIIIQHLETTGKDIGFTFRTFLAVVVSH